MDPPMGRGIFGGTSYPDLPTVDILNVNCKGTAEMQPLATSSAATY